MTRRTQRRQPSRQADGEWKVRRSSGETHRQSWTTFVELGGRKVELDEVRAHLAELQLDLVLGVLARISAHQIVDREFLSIQSQAQYLNCAIADDFPECLPNAAKMYVPGHAPLTGNRHVFIHEFCVATLTQLALLHCRNDDVTPTVSTRDFGRVCRLLLILNDHLFVPRVRQKPPTLCDRRRFAVDQLFYSQFNQVDGGLKGRLALGRLKKLLTIYLPKHLPDLDAHFVHSVGLSVDVYLQVAAFLLVQFPHSAAQLDRDRSPWWSLEQYAGSLRQNGAEVSNVLALMTQSPEEFRVGITKARTELFGFDELQRHPVIITKPGRVIAPAMTLMLRQVLSLPLQIVSGVGNGAGARALGAAYEEYAHSLVDRIAAGDRRGPWQSVRSHPVKAAAGSETAPAEIDSLLWRDKVAVVIEHKGGNLLRTLGSYSTLLSALGPSDEEIARFPAVPRKDSGAITHGLWQFARAAANGNESMKARFGSAPQRVFSLVNTLQAFEVDDWIREGYLNRLLPDVGFQGTEGWTTPEWIGVDGLEALAELADKGHLDLVEVLEKKSTFAGRFMVHLARCFDIIPPDSQLLQATADSVHAAGLRYFGVDLASDGDVDLASDGEK